ncbi:MAG: Crp/Fnr family transcriptional regulator [Candidatus Electryonea clarkiae]|nr:Crp/Fnr family transcriptional regulator [Candidatus Electryonea clarkiae]MDP8287730.1 Crp/Fnr family transcriptional regulator [Candidatus Electryonea clarkiae]
MDRETIWHLQNFNIFKAIPHDEMERLQDMVDTDWIKNRDPVYLQGEPTTWVYFLKKGLVKLSMTSAEGKTITVALLKPGEIFGELSGMDESDTSMEAIALENSYLCRIRREIFKEFVESHTGLVLSLNKILGLRIRRIQTAVRDLAFLDVPARLAKLLHSLCETDAEVKPNGHLITLRLTHQELANLIGASREIVTTVLGRFTEEGLLVQEKRRLLIKDPRQLKKYFPDQ